MLISHDIVAALVVPADGDPGGLLAPGRYGALPPVVRFYGDLGWAPYAIPSLYMGATQHLALPLWWDGALVEEAWDKARRVVWKGRMGSTYGWVLASECDPTIEQAIEFGRLLVLREDAARVVLLARDEDGRLVEVKP